MNADIAQSPAPTSTTGTPKSAQAAEEGAEAQSPVVEAGQPATTRRPADLAAALASLDLPAGTWEPVDLPAGSVLFEQGAPGDAFYLIQSGTLEAYLADADGRQVVLEQLGPGIAFGELALLDGGARTASIAAITDARLLRLRRETFLRVIEDSPELALRLLELVGTRWRRNLHYLDTLIDWARLVAEGRYEAAQAAIEAEAGSAGGHTAYFAQTFGAMVDSIKAREAALRQALQTLQIEIDQTKRAAQVAEVTESAFFESLVDEARRLRRGGEEKG